MDHAPGATHEPLPLDPEHDIDARSSTLWVVIGAIVLFISLWLMLPMLYVIKSKELHRKVESKEPLEFQNVKGAELEFLGGDNPKGKNIADVLKGLR